jgi:chromosome partitioning protein
METISISKHKGGVGKTATAYALGVSLAKMGYRTLLVDIDPQSSLTTGAGASAEGESIAEVLGGATPGPLPLSEILVEIADIEGVTLHLAPADIALSANELGLVQRIGRESILRNALLEVSDRYDLCLIDTPPSLGILTVNALRASAGAIVPTQAQISDLRGLKLFLDTVENIRAQINPGLEIIGILITFYSDRLIHHRDAAEYLEAQGLPLFETRIGRSIRVAESPAMGESIVTYDPDNPQAGRYEALAQEVNQWLRKEER